MVTFTFSVVTLFCWFFLNHRFQIYAGLDDEVSKRVAHKKDVKYCQSSLLTRYVSWHLLLQNYCQWLRAFFAQVIIFHTPIAAYESCYGGCDPYTQGNGTVLPYMWILLSKINFLVVQYPFEHFFSKS